MARPRRDDGAGRGAGSGRGIVRPRRVRREPEGSDRLQQLENQLIALTSLLQQLIH